MINKKTLINYSSVRSEFKSSIEMGFDYFKFITDFQRTNVLKVTNTTFNEELIGMHLDGSISAEEAIGIMDAKIFELFNEESNIDWQNIFGLVGRNNVFNIFNNMESLSNEDYWMILGFCYTTSDFAFVNSELLKEMFLTDRPKKEFLMNEEEREYLNSLPEELTIYRGCSVAEIESNQFRYSWTLSKKTAEFFAYEYNRNADIECSVVSKKISKSSVIAYFNDRTEEEIVYIE